MFDRDAIADAETVRHVGRRAILKGSAAAIFIAALPARGSGATVSKAYFRREERAFLDRLCDTLLPDSEAPGALRAGVPAVFDSMMRTWATPERAATFRTALTTIEADLDKRIGGRFVIADADRRAVALDALDKAAFGVQKFEYGEYREIKTMLVRLYYSSEIGATRELRYDPNPGEWLACVPLAEVGRTSAT